VAATGVTLVAIDYHPHQQGLSVMTNRWVGMLATLLVAAALWSPVSAGQPINPRQTWQLLDYVAVDYAGAVEGGRVIEPAEYAEMREFVDTVRAQVAALPETSNRSALMTEADQLVAAVGAKADPSKVADLAHHLADNLLESYPIGSAPLTPPNLAAIAPIYVQQCAACHGPTGRADGPAAASMNPPPVAFTDANRATKRTPLALYEVISQGLQGTAMASFSTLSDQDRWALAFYVGSLAYSPESRIKGQALWRDHSELRSEIPTLEALTRSSESELAKRIGDAQAHAITAYLRTNPGVVVAPPLNGTSSPFALARQRLAESTSAYAKNDTAEARALALSAYLDGVEPMEPTLAARDRGLMREIETAMGQFRAQLNQGASIDVINARSIRINGLFDRADLAVQALETNATTAFVGSFTVLLREGLEAMLIIIGMIAFLRKAERRDVLPYVHAGWIGALMAGVLTWAVATYLVGISGANREVTEGLSAIFAAVTLLSVGIWMHQKSLAGRWQEYLKAKMTAALTRRSAMFLFMLAFVAVYREVFETILFFIAMWSERNSTAILAGLLVGGAVLAGTAYWMLRISRRLPISQFFSISSMLIAVLAVVLVGKGVVALQEAGWIAQGLVAMPRIDWLGIYPSWQSLLAQLVVAVIALVGFMVNKRSARATIASR
jgi:high-affinity iron transporter